MHDDTDSFAQLFSDQTLNVEHFSPGQKIKARVIGIGRENVFIDLGGKSEGCVDRREFQDQEGKLLVAEGEMVEAYFLSAKRGDKIFTTKIAGSKGAPPSHLEDAWAGGIPVEGLVAKEIKGGYEVTVAGSVRAFCPFSQIDLVRSEDPSVHIGKHYPFKIVEFKENGKNVILSRRRLLEAEKQVAVEKLQAVLAVGMTVKGVIVSIRSFGAFVDIGGIQGLIPISEVSWDRGADITTLLEVGQEVTVEILKLDWPANRLSFSLKRMGGDPWQEVETKYPIGVVLSGKVVKLAFFGAFVELEPGVEGLVPISLLGRGRRLAHAREVVKEGDVLEVRVERIAVQEKRISLAPMNLEPLKEMGPKRKKMDTGEGGKEGRDDYENYVQAKPDASPESMGTLGDLLRSRLK